LDAARPPGYTQAMRHWLFHPLIFYPLAIAFAALMIALSVRPQSWPRTPAPVMAERQGEWLVWSGEAFNSPAQGADQEMTVIRDFLGRPLVLRIAQKKAQATPPTPAEDGVQILLSADDAAAIAGRTVTVEVSYNPLPVNAATELAVSLRGGAQTQWVTQAAPSQSATLRFRLPAQNAVNAIGLHAVSAFDDQAYGLEITRIRITPQT
jgi:hypothetical protein